MQVERDISQNVKVVYEAVFSSYGVICLLCDRWLLLASSSMEFFNGTVDCLEADRLEFHYRIAAHVQRNCVSKL